MPLVGSAQVPAEGTSVAAKRPTYGQLVSAGYDLLTEGKIKEAYMAALMAAQADPDRFESYALAALVMHTRGADAEAKGFVEKALDLAPADKNAKLRELAGAINDSGVPKDGLARETSISTPGKGKNASIPKAQRPVRIRIAPSSLGYVNLRQQPSTTSHVIAKVRPGEIYTVSRISGGWYHIGGGWVAGRYISVIKN